MMDRAAASGSGACQTGRPTTMWSAPLAMASAGVAMRFWSPGGAALGPDTGGDDQLALRLGQGADQGGLVRGGDDTVRTGGEGAGGAFHHEIGQRAVADQGGVEVGRGRRMSGR
jgi:hypothetical protein